jgi:4-amino-4-deoxy-L-arabinose transferase-like glycosyltransferase
MTGRFDDGNRPVLGLGLTTPPAPSTIRHPRIHLSQGAARMPSRRWILALVLLAIATRATAVLVLKSHLVPRSTYEHGEIATNLLASRGFSVKFLGADGPTSQQAPIYPLLVAGAYELGGIGTPTALLILELSQAVLGGLLVFAVMMLASEVAPDRPRIAILTGILAAFHPTLVYSVTHVQVAPVATVLLVGVLAWAYRTARTGRECDAVLTGFLLALLVLTDPILALAGIGVAWIIGGRQDRKRTLKLIALLGFSAVVGVTPWMVRNYHVHHELVWIKSTFGYAFWQGNCALSEGTDKVVRASVEEVLSPKRSRDLQSWNEALWKARHEAGYIDDIALSKADYRELSQLTEPERSRRLFRRALSDLRDQPGRYVQLCLRRLRYFLFFDETNPKTRSLIYRASHLGLTFLACSGWLAMGRNLRRKLSPTLLVAALITLFHTLTIVSARFHIPLEPLMGIWGAAGLAATNWQGARQPVRADRAPTAFAGVPASAGPEPAEAGAPTGIPSRRIASKVRDRLCRGA